jgi:hypothetical protein
MPSKPNKSRGFSKHKKIFSKAEKTIDFIALVDLLQQKTRLSNKNQMSIDDGYGGRIKF